MAGCSAQLRVQPAGRLRLELDREYVGQVGMQVGRATCLRSELACEQRACARCAEDRIGQGLRSVAKRYLRWETTRLHRGNEWLRYHVCWTILISHAELFGAPQRYNRKSIVLVLNA